MSRPCSPASTAGVRDDRPLSAGLRRSRIWSVVKANAYGHGIERVWNALRGHRWLRDAQSEEAILLRERGWKRPILLLEGFSMLRSWCVASTA
ncbi:alanine racemase [Shigella flexneri]